MLRQRLRRMLHAQRGGWHFTALYSNTALAHRLGHVRDVHRIGAVYLAGLVLGSREIPARRTISAFHEGVSWVAPVASRTGTVRATTCR